MRQSRLGPNERLGPRTARVALEKKRCLPVHPLGIDDRATRGSAATAIARGRPLVNETANERQQRCIRGYEVRTTGLTVSSTLQQFLQLKLNNLC